MPRLRLAFWDFEPGLNPDFRESLKIFYSRIPLVAQDSEPMLFDADVDRILKKASERPEVDWLCVMAVGTLFPAQDRIAKLIEDAVTSLTEPVLVMGHLIDKPGKYCGLHEQMFIVNMSLYRELDQPKFGGYEGGVKTLGNYTAGESHHGGYTPRELIPAPGTAPYTTWTCGWNLVNASMRAGFKIPNLPDDLRQEKIYAYPQDELAKLNRNLEMLYRLEDMPNPSQRKVIGFLLNKRLGFSPVFNGGGANLKERDLTVFLLNTEVLLVDRGWTAKNKKPLDAYIGPCAGFLDMAALHAYGSKPDTKVIYYDINPRAIEVRQRILQEYDGDLDHLLPFMERLRETYPSSSPFHMGTPEKAMAQIFKVFGDKETFRKAWRILQAAPKEFFELNLITGHGELLSRLLPGQAAVFAISDIFTGQNELTYGYSKITGHYRDFVGAAAAHPDLILTGKDVGGRAFVNFAKHIEF